MPNLIGVVDLDSLHELSLEMTELVPEESIGPFLSWIVAGIEEYGLVVIHDSDEEETSPLLDIIIKWHEANKGDDNA